MSSKRFALKKAQKRTVKRLILGALLTVASVAVSHLLSAGPILSLILILPAYLTVGCKTLTLAFKNITRGQAFDENFLMSIASLGALAIGEHFEAIAVLFFAQIGEIFESCAISGTRNSVKELAKLCPDTVNLLKNGNICTVLAEEVKIGDEFVVTAGERIALDSKVIKGTSTIDKSALTGESLPEFVKQGDTVPAGAINIDGELTLEALKVASDSFASRIIATVEDAAAKKSRAEALITKFAAWYTPIVCALAVAIAGILPIFFGGYQKSFVKFLYIALEFLVVSCPCALIISVPLTFFGAIGAAAKGGILFKSGGAVESLAHLELCVSDKTGTLTSGKLGITEILVSEDLKSEEDLKKIALAIERGSTHPIGRKITESFDGSVQANDLIFDEIKEIGGQGRVAKCQSDTYFAGNLTLASQFVENIPKKYQEISATNVLIGKNSSIIGAIVFEDMPKPQAKTTVSELKALGVRCMILSGDNKNAVKLCADRLGIDSYHGELLPSDKLALLEAQISGKTKGKCVAFIGDGINDSPALARADVGIAMGAVGSDAAIEAADVIISDDNIEKVLKACLIAKKANRISYQNIVFAIGVKVLIMILCALSVLNMWAAVFADVGVSVIAIINAMRALSNDN